MVKYAITERKDMYDVYIKNNRNSTLAASRYEELYPERRQPNRTTFRKIAQRLTRNGRFEEKKKKYRVRRGEISAINTIALINLNPKTSTNQISREIGMSQQNISKILRKHKYHPFKYQIVQNIHPHDAEHRLNFCFWLNAKMQENRNFLKKIIFTDESTFTNNGLFNRKNFHHWSNENPHVSFTSRHQVRFNVNVWCGLINNKILGPYFFDGHLNGARYLQFLRNEFEDMLDELPLQDLENLWMQQDGAPPHNTIAVTEYLNEKFPERWIGNKGPSHWPARSPDLNPLDYFLWGTVKDRVYSNSYNNVEELREAITNVINSISSTMVSQATSNLAVRVQKCIQSNGHQFEHL